MRNLSQGQPQAANIARSAFNVNYGLSGRDARPPAVNVNFSADANNNTQLNVNATATINTFFIRILPQWKTMKVSSNAQATRAKLIMSLVLDSSGSMNKNGGGNTLPNAVSNFIDFFDDLNDRVAMVTFSSNSKVPVSMRTNFKTPVKQAANGMKGNFNGGTFSQSGLANGQAQNDSVAVTPGDNVVKVAVFFTDGWANMNQDSLKCSGTSTKSVIYGGCAPPEAAVGWCGGTVSFIDPKTGNSTTCSATQFPSQQTGTMQTINITNVSNEAMYRAVKVADAMRAEQVPTVVYAIGMGDKINQTFLHQVANDSSSPTFNSNQPEGEAVFAPTAADLEGVFQTIASQILLRLTQ
jgi:hypothetical protein